MKRAIGYSVLVLCISLFLTGCLDAETVRIRLDLAENTGEAVYSNIVSDSLNEELIEDDFKSLLDIAYGEEEAPEGGDTQSRELYAEGGYLNGRIKYIFRDKEKLLETFTIRCDPGGKYVMDVDDDAAHVEGNGALAESSSGWDVEISVIKAEIMADFCGPGGKYVMDVDDDAAYVEGNGTLVESSSGLQMVWDGEISVIEAEIRADFSGKNLANLLPYWKDWQAWDSQDQPDSLELLTGQLGDAIEPSREGYRIDYCPDGTCYSFSSGLMSPGSFHRLADFAYIYLFNIFNDVSLEDFKASGGKQMTEIVSRNMRDCPDGNEDEDARCALRDLAKTYKIKLKSIVYEEMEKKETPVDIWTEL